MYHWHMTGRRKENCVTTDTETGVVMKTEKLTKYYGPSRGIVDIDLEVFQGEIFGFIGPNGAGKSTTIRLLLGLLFPTSGSGKIFGMDIVRKSREIKKSIGFIPSEVHYYPRMNGEELLAYTARFYHTKSGKRINELADYFKLDLRKKVDDLSRGNKKKIAIIQSVLHRPSLLIMDEPTSGLDPLMQQRFFDLLLRESSAGTTMFLSSHSLSEVQRLCRRVAIIKEGSIIKVEDIKSLRRKQLKKIYLEMAESVHEKDFEFSGITSCAVKGKEVRFLYSGDIREILAFLSKKKILNITIEEPELEEIFLHYYSETG
jgi:ABC-2 type transport system ATP-binding protein